jgi:hypothetical protein
MRVSAGFCVTGLSGKTLIQTLPPRLMWSCHGDTSRLDLAIGDPAGIERLEAVSPEVDLLLALGVAPTATALLLAVLGLARHQHQDSVPSVPSSFGVSGVSSTAGVSSTGGGVASASGAGACSSTTSEEPLRLWALLVGWAPAPASRASWALARAAALAHGAQALAVRAAPAAGLLALAETLGLAAAAAARLVLLAEATRTGRCRGRCRSPRA